MKKIFCIIALLAGGLVSQAQLTVDNAVNASDGVQNILLGAGVTVTNITFNGDNAQIGSFNCNGGCNLNIGYGLVMGSGNIDQTPGNTSSSSSMTPSSGFGATDPDLAELSGLSLNDAAVLQFDFESTGSTVAFNFVFGSDEYPEFVNAGFNDAFGFFLSGPGISGPYLNNAANIALIPNTTTPVTIDNVNDGLNSQYYVDNNGNVGNSTVIECDGFTTVLTAYAEVQCGETYHIKLAIADAGDTSYDSFVFLEAGSFESSELFSSFTSPNLGPPGGGLYEGCQLGYVNFVVPESNVDQVFNLEFAGTAQNGIDIDAIPAQILFPANQTELQIPINALSDGVLEGNESLVITVAGATACGEDVTVEVIISDLPELNVLMPDVTINCGDEAVLMPVISGGLGNYLVEWETGLISDSLIVYPSDPISYGFTVTDTCGVAPFEGIANILFVDNPSLAVNIGSDLELTCLEEINMIGQVSGGLGPY
ncbi:MAG: choice-of-anchor L domain-containing protein [Flavobacteriales bacterium]